jgi:6,7-dimethyl-8-ribityllumazine synthase
MKAARASAAYRARLRRTPVANAVLTTETDEQAVARMSEKGRDAARVAVEMANLSVALEQLTQDDDEEDEDLDR